MRVEYACNPSYTIAYCYLAVGEQLITERDAMVAMSDGIEVSAGVGSGGVARAAARKVLGQESFLVGYYRAVVPGAWVAVAPRFPGDVTRIDIGTGQLHANSGAFLAATADVNVKVRYSGAQRIVTQEGATMLTFDGNGVALLAGYGGIQHIRLEAGHSITVDSGHLLAWRDTIDTKVGTVGTVAAAAATGEGLATRLTGPGDAWISTRSAQSLGSWLLPNRPQNDGAGR